MAQEKYQRIILHAGLHKTGTTSIQHNCFKHREFLAGHGIFYPTFNFRDRVILNHSDPLTGAVGSAPGLYGMPHRMHVREDPTEARQAFNEQFKEVLKNPQGDTLLLSAEAVCDYIEKDLVKLRLRLHKFARELKVVAFVRSPQSSLESILQQRNLAGNVVDPHSLVGVVTRRYKRLQKAFPDMLQVYNFHEAVQHPGGLVGYFLCSLGLPLDEVKQLDFGRSNERVSLEAHTLIEAINRAYPADGDSALDGVERVYQDTRALYKLPGQPFRIEAFQGSGLYDAVTREAESLEQLLGFHFPQSKPGATEPLWQMPTLMALEGVVSRLDSKHFRGVVARTLVDEASGLESTAPATAATLRFIARQIDALEDQPSELLLEKLGPDYFKFAALQVERECPEMALQLMTLAGYLRPEAEFIKERIRHYQDRLQKS